MNRKEFTNLLLEWRKNFVNERTTPQLQQHVRRKLPVDVIFCNLPLSFSKEKHEHEYEQLLKRNGKDPKKPENVIDFTGYDDPLEQGGTLSYTINKSKDFYDILTNMEDAFPSQEDKQKFIEAYTLNKKDPAILISQFQGDITAKRNEYKSDTEIAALFYWVVHDLIHDLFDDEGHFDRKHNYGNYYNPTKSFLYSQFMNPNKKRFAGHQYTTFSKEEYESGKLKEKPNPLDVKAEFAYWFHSINYTPYVGSGDIIPSMFSYCIVKLPEEEELAKKEISKLELSNEAKSMLLEAHKEAHKGMKMFIDNFGGKILIFGKNTNI